VSSRATAAKIDRLLVKAGKYIPPKKRKAKKATPVKRDGRS